MQQNWGEYFHFCALLPLLPHALFPATSVSFPSGVSARPPVAGWSPVPFWSILRFPRSHEPVLPVSCAPHKFLLNFLWSHFDGFLPGPDSSSQYFEPHSHSAIPAGSLPPLHTASSASPLRPQLLFPISGVLFSDAQPSFPVLQSHVFCWADYWNS